MAFWNKKRRPNVGLDRQVVVKGHRRLGIESSTHNPHPRRELRRIWEPRALGRVSGVVNGGSSGSFAYKSGHRGDFYRWMRDSIPIISAGVWAWVRLCSTETSALITGTAAERLRAEEALHRLDRRILESPYGRGSGFSRLTEAFFLELFTTGRFAGEAVLAEDGRSVDHFRFIDPYRVGWEHTDEGWTPVLDLEEPDPAPNQTRRPKETTAERIDPRLFFYGTLGTDITNPSGIEPLAAIPFVTEIEELMLEDMARSSHNAGTPRLQIKIGRPERFTWEGESEYTERANRYFEQLASQFGNLEPDDNIFTWNDVEVTMVGGAGKQWEWRLNRDQVVEDVITGLRLFPWVLGRTHKTTMNWVQSQFDLLMQMVSVHQQVGADLINWLTSLELELKGIDARVQHRFAKHPDPFRLERAQAERTEFDMIDLKVQRGYITKEDGARMMGLPGAAKKDADADGR